ncbi:hypothetical protein QJS10_CPA03g01280 [Acorus calamus]|uniref:Uncharacterized protein n=1 Tax=Acorus calamus TaxID=4465 RepID=A0AAV9F646_ACOCL|nr:hypothetical protein QJS10_CPA03g01280 [Acorus calamus]
MRLGVVDGIWMVGVIDEIRLSINESDAGPLLIDTKTRCTAKLPGKAQERKSRTKRRERMSLLKNNQLVIVYALEKYLLNEGLYPILPSLQSGPLNGLSIPPHILPYPQKGSHLNWLLPNPGPADARIRSIACFQLA